MKAVKLVRLQEKDNKGKFKKSGNHVVLRENVIISEESIAESEASYEDTGMLYIVLAEEKPAKEEKAK